MKEVNFVSWYLLGTCDEETDTTLVLFSDEALVHVSGYVNYRNKRHLSAENHMLVHKVPLHHSKVSAWYAMLTHSITRPV
jgi:hypothetical protein